MIIITRTFQTLSPSGGCNNFINHRETKCFKNDDFKGVEDFLNVSAYDLRKKCFGYTVYNLNYKTEKI